MAPPPRGESYEADHKSIVCHKEAVLLNTWVSQLSPHIFFSAADWPGGRLWKGTAGRFFLITGANTVNTAAAGTRAHVRTELVWQMAKGAGIRLLFKDLRQRRGRKQWPSF